MNNTASEAARWGLSDEYWARLSPEHRAMYGVVRPLRKSTYTVHNPIRGIEDTLATLHEDAQRMGGVLDLNPDFQRGHVWSQDKQIAFIESVLRGVAPMTIRFNSPGWSSQTVETDGLNPNDVLCVDGLQRLTAMRAFMAGEFKVFGRYDATSLEGSPFSLGRSNGMWIMEMFDIRSRAELLQFYLDINSGGVVHTDEELDRVRTLQAQAAQGAGATMAEDAPKARKARSAKA